MSGVTVVGSLNLDQALTVRRLPAPGETVHASEFTRSAGGKGANQAVSAAKLGARVELLGAVGTDHAADFVLGEVSRAGVGIGGVVRLPYAATGQAIVVVEETGENLIVVQPGANGALEPAAVTVGDASVVLLGFEVPDAVVIAAAAEARARGARVILNPSPLRAMPPDLAGLVDILIVNEHELAGLTDMASVTDDALTAAAEHLACDLVVTLGARGAVLAERGRSPVWQPSVEVDVVDTSGCGDAFAGAFASALAEGEPAAEALRRAVHAGAYAATGRGTQSSYATRDQLAQWVAGLV